MIGQTISHYHVLEKIGEGGMGTVYKAEDTRLKRTVALKFLPAQAGGDEDRERFLREAQAAAALDHPNICTIYEIDEAAGRPFLAMAYLPGRTLDRRIEEGPLPLAEALRVAVQAAEGLGAAHERGVVHRDVKPSNLMLLEASGGRVNVKILDFGLAQLANRSKITQQQSLIGTIAYMSPEQTQGDKVDARTDIWALGCTIYEMIAGEPPFKGHYEQATMYSILNEAPEPLTSLRSRVPVELDWIVDKCLAKAPAERYQSAADLILDLTTLEKKLESRKLSMHRSQIAPPPDGGVRDGSSDSGPAVTPPPTLATESSPTPARPRRAWMGALAAAVVGLALGAVVFSGGEAQPEAPRPTQRFDVMLPAELAAGTAILDTELSPDGRRLAFVTSAENDGIWIRDLGQVDPWKLQGTEGATSLFWSPDGAFIGYRAADELRKVALQGGVSTTLCPAPGPFFAGAAWSPDSRRVVFFEGPPVQAYEVSSLGGEPRRLFEASAGSERRDPPLASTATPKNAPPAPPPDARPEPPPSGPAAGPARGRFGRQEAFGHPHWLPGAGGSRLLYTLYTAQGAEIVVRDLDGPEEAPKVIMAGSSAVYSAGHLIYHPTRDANELWAVAFDVDDLETTGEPFPIATAALEPTASEDGTLAYVSDIRGGDRQLVWRDRAGAVVGEIGAELSRQRDPVVSPDGNSIAVVAEDGAGPDVYVHETARNRVVRLTRSEASEASPVWSPSGSLVAFTSFDDGGALLQTQSSMGGPARELLAGRFFLAPFAWTSDGIYVRRRQPGRGGSVERIDPDAVSPQPETIGDFGRMDDARLSPDGRYIAFQARELDAFDVFVRPFPDGDGFWKVSTSGGEAPRWSLDGSEIFFVQGSTLMAAEVRRRPQFSIGDTTALFSTPALRAGLRAAGYDVGPDGRFAVVQPSENAPPAAVRLTLSWPSEFRE